MRPSPDEIAAHNRIQRQHYDVMDATNPRMRPAATTYVNRHVDRMIRLADLRRGERILDVGCGMGKFTIPLLRRGYDVEGLDLSPDLLRVLRRNLRDGEDLALHCADLVSAPAELAGRFDAVVGFFMLHHLVDLPLAFGAMRRFLKPGGRVAFVEPNAFDPLYYVQITLTRGMSWRADRGVTRMTRRRLSGALAEAGYRDIRTERQGALPPVLMNRSWGPPLEAAIEWFAPLRPISAFQLVRAELPD